MKQNPTVIPLSSSESCVRTVQGYQKYIGCTAVAKKCSLMDRSDSAPPNSGELLLALDMEEEEALSEVEVIVNDKEAQLKLSRCNVCMKR